MKARVGRKVGMSKRVAVFVRANPPSDQGHQAAVTRFEARVTLAEVLLQRQSDGRLSAKATRNKRRTVRAEIDQYYLRHLVTVGAAAAQDDPGRFGVFQRPGLRVRDLAFSNRVRSMLEVAKAGEDVLKPLGLGDGLLDDLAQELDEFDRLITNTSEHRAAHVAATKDLNRVVAELTETVAVLDGMYRYRFRAEPELLAQWANVRDAATVHRTRSKAPEPPISPVQGEIDRAA